MLYLTLLSYTKQDLNTYLLNETEGVQQPSSLGLPDQFSFPDEFKIIVFLPTLLIHPSILSAFFFQIKN